MSKNGYTDKYIISLLNSVINGITPTEYSSDIDWDRFIKIATEHHISNTIYYAIEKLNQKPPKNICDELYQAHIKALMREANQQAENELIINEFSNNGIRCLPLKGYNIKKYYPSPDMRYMSDLDVLIDADKVNNARDILENIGYTFEFSGKVHDNYTKKPIMHIELHKCLMDDDMKNIADYYNSSDGFSRGHKVSDNSLEYTFSDEEFYIYMISHSAKHYLTFGTGILAIMDIYIFLSKKREKLNYEYINNELKKLKLTKLNGKLVALANMWFDNASTDKSLYEMSNYIISSGAYGKYENDVLHKFLNKSNSNGSLFAKKIKYFFFMTFPNTDYISGKYPKVKEKKWLLPFYWIKRWFSSLFFNRESIRVRLFSVLRTKKNIANLYTYVKDDE